MIREIPLVSVIIPCYNAEKTICKTLKSLENQTFDNFEVLLINDGSSDSSEKVISNFVKNSNLVIHYIVQENSGVSAARNKGLQMAKGKLISFLDADDIYHQDFLKKLVEPLEQDNVDTSFCNYTRNIEMNNNNRFQNKMQIDLLNHSELLQRFMYRKGPCGFFTFLYRKSIIDKNNIRFNEDTKYGEDLEFTWKYLANCEQGVYLNLPLYGYRDNPYSAINNVSWRITDSLHSVKRVEKYLEERNDNYYIKFKKYMYDRTVWAVLKDFARSGNKEDYLKLSEEFYAKKSMKKLFFTSRDIRIKVTSLIYCLNKNAFFYLVRRYYS